MGFFEGFMKGTTKGLARGIKEDIKARGQVERENAMMLKKDNIARFKTEATSKEAQLDRESREKIAGMSKGAAKGELTETKAFDIAAKTLGVGAQPKEILDYVAKLQGREIKEVEAEVEKDPSLWQKFIGLFKGEGEVPTVEPAPMPSAQMSQAPTVEQPSMGAMGALPRTSTTAPTVAPVPPPPQAAPPQLGASPGTTPNQKHIQYLREHPEFREQFIAKFGEAAIPSGM